MDFSPLDADTLVSIGKSHLGFWTYDGTTLSKKQGIFDVSYFFSSYNTYRQLDEGALYMLVALALEDEVIGPNWWLTGLRHVPYEERLAPTIPAAAVNKGCLANV